MQEWESAFDYLIKGMWQLAVEGLNLFTLLDLPFHSLGVSLHIEEIQEVLVGAHFLVAPGPKTLDLLKTPANPKPPGLPIPPPIPLLPRKPSLMEMGLLLPRL